MNNPFVFCFQIFDVDFFCLVIFPVYYEQNYLRSFLLFLRYTLPQNERLFVNSTIFEYHWKGYVVYKGKSTVEELYATGKAYNPTTRRWIKVDNEKRKAAIQAAPSLLVSVGTAVGWDGMEWNGMRFYTKIK